MSEKCNAFETEEAFLGLHFESRESELREYAVQLFEHFSFVVRNGEHVVDVTGLLGHGLGSLMRVPWAVTWRHDITTEGLHPAVDYSPLAIAYKAGLVGLLVTLWVVLRLVQVLWRRLRDAPCSPLAIALYWGVLGLLALGLGGTWWGRRPRRTRRVRL